jgi:hypothetical protein
MNTELFRLQELQQQTRRSRKHMMLAEGKQKRLDSDSLSRMWLQLPCSRKNS